MRELKVKNGKIKLGKDYFLYNNKKDISEELYTTYAEILASGETSSNTFLGQLLNKNFKKMAASDTCNAINAINTLERIATSTKNYFDNKSAADTDYTKYLLDRNLMPWQREVLKDPAHYILLLAGRRAGKTYEIASQMIDHCLKGYDEYNGVRKPREAIYIGLTKEKAAEIIWNILKNTIEKVRIPVSKINNSKYRIEFSNGAAIQILGNGSKDEREKIRGFDSSMYVIDECQSQVGLLYILETIIGPIVRGRNGIIMLSGTGPLSAGTYWESCILSDTWSKHTATMKDNITIPDYEHALENTLKEHNWTPDNITFRREYLGEIAYDTNRLVYPSRYYWNDLPTTTWKECYIGVDWGYVHTTAFAPIIIDNNNNMYLVNEFKQAGMSSEAKVNKAKELNEFIHSKYNIPYDKIKMICDNNEPGTARDIYNAGITNIQGAYKQNQLYQIGLVRDALESEGVRIRKGGYFDQECDSMVWKWNPEKNSVIYELDDNVYHGDICDAVQYAVATWYSDNVGVN